MGTPGCHITVVARRLMTNAAIFAREPSPSRDRDNQQPTTTVHKPRHEPITGDGHGSAAAVLCVLAAPREIWPLPFSSANLLAVGCWLLAVGCSRPPARKRVAGPSYFPYPALAASGYSFPLE